MAYLVPRAPARLRICAIAASASPAVALSVVESNHPGRNQLLRDIASSDVSVKDSRAAAAEVRRHVRYPEMVSTDHKFIFTCSSSSNFAPLPKISSDDPAEKRPRRE